jgi:phosphatidylserine/phosphatidylglycerophosphate/cardiolipin synthase-like enzyme
LSHVRLLTTAILSAFARLAHANRGRIYRVWLVSPWISTEDSGKDPLLLLLDALRGTTCDLILFTRPPDSNWHREAVDLLRANARTIVYYCRTLHTKLYILECDGFRAAVLGSPNLTGRADRHNLEIAVEFRSTIESESDDIASVITELTQYASVLRGDTNFTLA